MTGGRMDRRTFLTVVGGAAAAPMLTRANVGVAAPPPPNVVVIMTDDQTPGDMLAMPKTLRLLGQEGTTFSNSFASHPLCGPSRASALTGVYGHNHGIRHNSGTTGGFFRFDWSNHIGLWMQAAGYRTACIGKTMNGYGGKTTYPAGWDTWKVLWGSPQQISYNYRLNENGSIRTYGSAASDHLTDVLAGHSAEFIGAAGPKPFFLMINPLACHIESGPPKPPPRHVGAFASASLPRGGSFDEVDVSDKPRSIRALPRLSPSVITTMTRLHRARLESLLGVDDLVERVIMELDRRGALTNTLIIFTSDNGYALGQHRLVKAKNEPYEETARVPLIVRGPGFERGRSVSSLVSNVDLVATVLRATGANARLPQDGVALQQPLVDRALYLHSGPFADGTNVWFEAVRTDRYLYVERTNGEREFYDLATDPDQLNSRHQDPSTRTVREELARKLADFRGCRGATCATTYRSGEPPPSSTTTTVPVGQTVFTVAGSATMPAITVTCSATALEVEWSHPSARLFQLRHAASTSPNSSIWQRSTSANASTVGGVRPSSKYVVQVRCYLNNVWQPWNSVEATTPS